MFEDLQDEEALLGLHDVGQVVSLHLQVRNLFRLLPLGVDFDFPQRDLLGAHEFGFVALVILGHFLIADGDVRTDFAADHPLRQQSVADVVLEILPIHSLGRNRPLQFFHTREIVLSANGIELLDDFGFYTYAHVFRALHQERLIDQVAQGVFLAIPNVGLQLLGSATILAFGLGIFFGGLTGFLVLRTRDDLVVDPGDDLLDGLPAIGINRLRRRRHTRLLQHRSGRFALRGGGRYRLWRGFRLVLCRERQGGAQHRDYG